METTEKYKLTVNCYGNVDGIPHEWIQSKLTKTQLKKLKIPFYKSCVGFEITFKKMYKPIVVNIIHTKFIEIEKKYIEQLKSNKEKNNNKIIDIINYNKEKIVEAIYSINKEAKKYRDKQNIISDYLFNDEINDEIDYESKKNHNALHAAKNKKEYLYFLKEKALLKLIKENAISAEGKHYFPSTRKFMAFYKIYNFEFHISCSIYNNNIVGVEHLIYLGDIDEEITSLRKRSMPPKKSIELIEKYIEND